MIYILLCLTLSLPSTKVYGNTLNSYKTSKECAAMSDEMNQVFVLSQSAEERDRTIFVCVPHEDEPDDH